MKKPQIIILILVVSSIVTAFTINNSVFKAASRGKVIPDEKSSIMEYKIENASMFSFQVQEDSVMVSGFVCEIGNNDQPTGNEYPIEPRKFHKKFVFGCDENGWIVWFKVNKKKAKIYFKKPKN